MIGDQWRPRRSMVGAKKSGAMAMPIEPPVMCTDMAKPLFVPEAR